MPDVMYPRLLDDKELIDKYFNKKKKNEQIADILPVDGWSLEKIDCFEE